MSATMVTLASLNRISGVPSAVLLASLWCRQSQAQQNPSPPAASALSDDLKLGESHYNTGLDAFNEGRFAVAAVEFMASYELTKRPGLLHNISVSYERLGRYAEAIRLEERYMQEALMLPLEERPNQSEQDEIRGRLSRLDQALRKADAGVLTTPTTALRNGAPPPIVRSSRWAQGLLIGVGGASLIASVGTVSASYFLVGRLEGEPHTLAEYNRISDDVIRLNRASGALFGIGLSLGVAGGVWLLAEHYGQHKTP